MSYFLGVDNSEEAALAAKTNLKSTPNTQVYCGDTLNAKDLERLFAAKKGPSEEALLICNPPYSKRLASKGSPQQSLLEMIPLWIHWVHPLALGLVFPEKIVSGSTQKLLKILEPLGYSLCLPHLNFKNGGIPVSYLLITKKS